MSNMSVNLFALSFTNETKNNNHYNDGDDDDDNTIYCWSNAHTDVFNILIVLFENINISPTEREK